MARKAKESTVAEAVQSVTATPTEEPEKKEPVENKDGPLIGTSRELFPDFMESEEVENEPKPEPEPEKEEEEEPKEEEEEPPKTVADIGDTRVEVVIDGEKRVITGRELLKGYQTDQHLSRKGNELGELKKQIEALQLESLKKTKDVEAKKVEVLDENKDLVDAVMPSIKPLFDAYENRIAELTQNVQALTQSLKPSILDTAFREIDVFLKKEGFNDLVEYRPRVEEYIEGLPPEDRKQWYSKAGIIQAYKEFKLNDLIKNNGDQKPSKTEAAPPKKPIVKVEGGSNTSSNPPGDQAGYDEAIKKARETGEWGAFLSKYKSIPGL